MRMLAANGVGLHWREDGDFDGRPVVFSNSLGTDLRVWDDLVALLPARARLIRYDTRGHGLSECPGDSCTLDDLVDDAAALLDGLGVKKCVFVGLSIGGMIAQGLAARRPDLVHAVVLSNTAARMGTPELWQTRIAAIRSGGMDAIAQSVMARWFSPGFLSTAARAAWRNMLTRTPAAGYIACCRALADADLSVATRALDLPVLGIAGSEDGASPPEQVRATIAPIPGARYEEIVGAGHLPCVEAPGPTAALVTKFLKEIGHV